MMNSEMFVDLFKHADTLPWRNTVDTATIINLARQNFPKLAAGKTRTKHYCRLAGQSGSGKTTQLLPASSSFFAKHNLKPMVLAVRTFAELHPQYNDLMAKYGKKEIREVTNAFALRCLLVTIMLALANGYDVLLDLTLLTKEIETFINRLLNKNKYHCLILLLCVNVAISNFLIAKRQALTNPEGERIVYQSSANFFYTTLREAVKFYTVEFGDLRVIIWNAFLPQPLYDGAFAQAGTVFFPAIAQVTFNFNDEALLRKAKTEYLITQVKW